MAPNSHPNSRQYSLDILRGFFIFLAIWQHYVYYYNYWFIDYFKDNTNPRETIFGVYQSFIDKALPCDDITYWAFYIFTPWVSQIYLFLASFNLGRHPQNEFKASYKKKMGLFLLIFVFFTAENFIVAPNFGEALIIYPIQIWMLIMAGISTCYYLLGTKSIILLSILSLLRFTLPANVDIGLEDFVQTYLHNEFDSGANPFYFLTSGTLGFLLARFYFGAPTLIVKNKRLLIAGSIGVFICVIYYVFGIPNKVDRENAFFYEYLLINNFLGAFYLWAIQTVVVSSFLLLEAQKYIPRIKILELIGIYSISIFAIHRIFFVHLFMPMRLFFGAIFSYPPENNTLLEIWPAAILCMISFYFIKKIKMLELIFK